MDIEEAMCIAIYQPIGKRVPIDRLREAHKANPDGWGIMWPDGKGIGIAKSVAFVWFEPYFQAISKFFPDCPMVIHFRTASMGQITIEACHPHKVNDNLAFVHNGNLFHFSDYFYGNDGLTDSQRFRDFIQKHTPHHKNVEDYCIRNYSKMVLMNNLGEVNIINEQAGMWENGCWFSNGGIEHYVGYGYSGAYPYSQGEVRHKGGLISVQGYSGKWKQCKLCKGWFRNIKRLCEDCQSYESLSGN